MKAAASFLLSFFVFVAVTVSALTPEQHLDKGGASHESKPD